jgi:hypothetical protein
VALYCSGILKNTGGGVETQFEHEAAVIGRGFDNGDFCLLWWIAINPPILIMAGDHARNRLQVI